MLYIYIYIYTYTKVVVIGCSCPTVAPISPSSELRSTVRITTLTLLLFPSTLPDFGPCHYLRKKRAYRVYSPASPSLVALQTGSSAVVHT